jgi:hypothetical protein
MGFKKKKFKEFQTNLFIKKVNKIFLLKKLFYYKRKIKKYPRFLML